MGAGIRDVARRKHATVAEWFKAADLRSAHSLSGTGSNPVGGIKRRLSYCVGVGQDRTVLHLYYRRALAYVRTCGCNGIIEEGGEVQSRGC